VEPAIRLVLAAGLQIGDAIHKKPERTMTIGVAHLSQALSIIFGVSILIMPRFLNYFVVVYLFLEGLLGLGGLR
jgi:hypothetical protein